MTTVLKIGLAAAVAALAAGVAGAGDKPDPTRFSVRADLIGYQEVPALSTVAKGNFEAWVDTESNVIYWKLKYDGLEGTVTQAHVHFGQMGVNGGISFFLCSNLGNGPAGTQACPAGPAVLEGTVTPDLVLGPGAAPPAAPGQGIEPGAFAEIAAAIKAGVSYANVHTTKWPGGEIRGQLR
jgi:hypothetical protein